MSVGQEQDTKASAFPYVTPQSTDAAPFISGPTGPNPSNAKATWATIFAQFALTMLGQLTDIDFTTLGAGKVLTNTPSNGKAYSWQTPSATASTTLGALTDIDQTTQGTGKVLTDQGSGGKTFSFQPTPTAQLNFDITGDVGPNNPVTAVVRRIPLLQARSFSSCLVIGDSIPAGAQFQISLDAVAPTGTVPSGSSTATAGQQMFSALQNLPASETLQQFNFTNPNAVWPAGHELTLRVITTAGDGLSNLKVVLL